MDKKDYPQHYLEKYHTFKNLLKVLLWLDKGQFGGQKVEFGVYFLIPCPGIGADLGVMLSLKSRKDRHD